MHLSFYPETLVLKHEFTVSVNSRKTTPIVLTKIEHEGITGYGEASLPPYLAESHESVMEFLSRVDLLKYDDIFTLEKIISEVDKISPGNNAAKASVDIALHDLFGKKLKQPLYKIFGLDKNKIPYTSFTIGIDNKDKIVQKVKEADEFNILKIKLGKGNDKEIIKIIRSLTDKPLTVDINQGWNDKYFALDMINWLSEENILFIEQPLPKNMIDEMAWLTEKSPLPTIADESVQKLEDVKKSEGVFTGINIKLMKSSGIREAYKMIIQARALNLKILIGCMTETSCGISAASQLAPMADWVDLDGALLIKNDFYEGTKIINGEVILSDEPGIGLK